MVRTRTFSEAVSGESITLMAPYADLANVRGAARAAAMRLCHAGVPCVRSLLHA